MEGGQASKNSNPRWHWVSRNVLVEKIVLDWFCFIVSTEMELKGNSGSDIKRTR